MDSRENVNFESTRIKIPVSEHENGTDDDPLESVRLDLENSLAIDAREIPVSPPKSLALRNKLSGLNSKLSTYVANIKKTEIRLAESLQEVKRLEEANTVLKQDSRQQLEFLRSELDEQIRKAVLAEEQRSEVAQRLESCLKQSSQLSSDVECLRDRVAELEENLVVERQRSKDALEELVVLREQMFQERKEYTEQKRLMMDLKIEYAKLQERFKINAAELTSSQAKLCDLQNHAQFSSEDVDKKLSELKQRLEKKFSDRMAEKINAEKTEIKVLKGELQKRVQDALRSSVSSEDFDLLKTQLEEQQRRTESAESEADDWRRKFHEAQNKLERAEKDYAKQLEEERRRREKLNKRLLAQSRTQNEVKQELETYRKLIEGLDPEENSFADALNSMGTQEAVVGLLLSPGSPLRRSKLTGGTPNSPEARTRLLRRALTPRRRSLTREPNSVIQAPDADSQQPHET